MPYILQSRRDLLDPAINDLGDFMQDVGDLNYIVTRLTLHLLMRDGLSYENINNTLGTVQLSFNEMYRRIAAEYEDFKLRENGDIPELFYLLRELRNMKLKSKDIAADAEQAHG
jgi:hypothetical protein